MAVGMMTPPQPEENPMVDALVQGYKALTDAVNSSYFDIVVQGLENVPADGAVIIIGNHPSLLDGHLLHYALPRTARFIVHRAWSHHPLLKWVADSMGYLPAEKGGNTVAKAEEALHQGGVMAVFPEGWTFDPKKTREWRPGVAVMALHTGVPVVPVGIAGSEKAMPSDMVPRPGSICLSFGKPLQYMPDPSEHVDPALVEQVLGEMRAAIEAEVEAAEQALDNHEDPRNPLLVQAAEMLVQPVATLLSLTVPRRRRRRKRK
ncbi:MAG: lysophospholipid acyltransferase family protein [Candidatus Xenobia bacterium]